MYNHLFAKANYLVLAFERYSIKLMSTDGEIANRSSIWLSPPYALQNVLKDKFNLEEETIQELSKGSMNSQ